MNRREARAEGREAGLSAALYCEEPTVECAFEAEENARQYSPFEFLASEINGSRDPEGLWDAYDEGVQSGVEEGIRDRKGRTGRRGRRNPIDLRSPEGSERVRGFQPPWYTVYLYRCKKCGKQVRVRAGSFRGKHAEPGHGAIMCPHCERERENPPLSGVRAIGSNMTEAEHGDATILYSYATPVAAFVSGRGFFRTSEKFSVTTSRHINKWLAAEGGSGRAKVVPQTEIERMARDGG